MILIANSFIVLKDTINSKQTQYVVSTEQALKLQTISNDLHRGHIYEAEGFLSLKEGSAIQEDTDVIFKCDTEDPQYHFVVMQVKDFERLVKEGSIGILEV